MRFFALKSINRRTIVAAALTASTGLDSIEKFTNFFVRLWSSRPRAAHPLENRPTK